jgi:hypothetical protein
MIKLFTLEARSNEMAEEEEEQEEPEEENDSLPLDVFMDQTLTSDPERKRAVASESWEKIFVATQRLSLPSSSQERSDPFVRMFSLPIGERAFRLFGNEDRTLSELSFLAVQPLLDPERLDAAIARAMGRYPSPISRRMIVYHGAAGAMRSVLVLDPTLPSNAPATVVPMEAYASLLMTPSVFSVERIRRLNPVLSEDPNLLAQALWIAQPNVVVVPAPPMIKTCVPTPPWRVMLGEEASTVGAIVRDSTGRLGVTVCYHGTGDVDTQVQISEDGEAIDGTVALASEALDTCFVPIPDNWRPAAMCGVAGMLETRAPGKTEPHHFNGFQHPAPKVTEIIAVDWGVPFPIKGRQLCVQTKADTNYGDSGAALLNTDDRLVGFAFQRTPYGGAATIEFADWIWAPSALNELGLTLFKGY